VTEPRWLSLTVVLAIHSDQIREHGGSLGVRDKGLLESALARPRNLVNYQPQSDVLALAASYGFGIAKNHPFIDGNKRVAFQVMYTFLGLNGFTISATEPEAVEVMLALASGAIGESEVEVWLRGHTQIR
jgi:death-on-curing protein